MKEFFKREWQRLRNAYEPRRWWCDNCWRAVNLNTHLRCEICDSDAVLELERLHGTETVVSDAENRNRGK